MVGLDWVGVGVGLALSAALFRCRRPATVVPRCSSLRIPLLQG